MVARKHHYVPQCYLKGFVENREKPRLFTVDVRTRRSFLANPENVAAERDFHINTRTPGDGAEGS